MVLGLIWYFISSVSCWGNLGIIFPLKERERETLALSSKMASSESGCCLWIGKDPGVAFSQKIEVTRLRCGEKSLMVSSLLHSLFLSSSYSRSSSPPLIFDRFSFLLLQIFFLCFLLLQIHEEKLFASLYQWKTLVPLVAPLSRHCGFSFERLEGFSLLKVQINSFLCFLFFLFVTSLLKDNGFWVVRRRLHKIPAPDVFSSRFKDFLLFFSSFFFILWRRLQCVTELGWARIHENMKRWKTTGRELL